MAKLTKIQREHIRTGQAIDKLCAAGLSRSAAGLSRSANLSKKAFLKSIGRPEATNTEQAERETIFNLASECLKTVIQVNRKIELLEANVRYTKGE